MTTPSAPTTSPTDRLLDLLADRALFGLDDADRTEFSKLSPGAPFDEFHELDLAAGALTVALLGADIRSPVPDGAIRRVRSAATAWDAARNAVPEPPRRLTPRTVSARASASIGWFAGAACLALAVLAWSNRPSSQTPPQQYAQMLSNRDELVRTAPDLVRIPWTATEDLAAASGVTGEVIWSDARDEGYMHIKGLASNNPAAEQYQLWVFDADRDERYPVDGGVFDIPDVDYEIIIPITAKVPVSHATLFAVTVEKPGGAVVSSRERIPILAKAEPQ